MAIFLSRIRLPAVAVFLGLSIANRFFPVLPGGWPAWLAGLALIAVLLRAGTLWREPVAARPPVTGPWRALNSPATRVPSHGIQGYGQAHAIDLVYDPADPAHPRPRFAWWPPARRPQDFPGFGQPVYAPADGVVVRVHDRERDHWSRTSPLGLLYLFTAELLRELTGPRRVVGNHVVIDLGDGVYAVLAHLRRRSISFTAGQHVRAGDQVAECGNSGNATEPHLKEIIACTIPDRNERAPAGGPGNSSAPPDGRRSASITISATATATDPATHTAGTSRTAERSTSAARLRDTSGSRFSARLARSFLTRGAGTIARSASKIY